MKIPSLLSFLVAFALVSCDSSKTAETPSQDKDAEIEALRAKLKALSGDLEEKAGDRERLIAKYDGAIDSLKDSVEELDSKMQTVEEKKIVEVVAEPEEPAKEEASEQIDIAAIRRAAVGEKHEKLELNLGRVYHNVTITGIDDIGVKFTHRDGVARIDFLNLPDSWKERFHFDVGRFLETRKAEQLAQYRREKSIDEKMAVIREERKKARDKERIEELELALTKAKNSINKMAQTSKPALTRVSTSLSSLDRYSTVLYPTLYTRRASYDCPPVTSSGSIGSAYRPTPSCPSPRPVTRVPIVRPSVAVCPPVVRPPVVRPPVIRSAYKTH
jgi:hypothetical protein